MLVPINKLFETYSEIIDYYKQVSNMMSGKQKDFWEQK